MLFEVSFILMKLFFNKQKGEFSMKKYTIKLFIGFSLLIWGQWAHAANEGLYLGVNASYENYNSTVTEDGLNTNLDIPIDLKGFSPEIFVGFRQSSGWFTMAVEGRYGYAFADDSVDLSLIGIDKYEFSGGHSFGIALLPGVQVTQDIIAYTRFGYASSQYEEKITVGLLETSAKDYQSGFEYGLGVQFNFSKNMAFRAEFTRTDYSDVVITTDPAVGVNFTRDRFSLGFLINY